VSRRASPVATLAAAAALALLAAGCTPRQPDRGSPTPLRQRSAGPGGACNEALTPRRSRRTAGLARAAPAAGRRAAPTP
jgi:hypothetical protein